LIQTKQIIRVLNILFLGAVYKYWTHTGRLEFLIILYSNLESHR